MKRLLGLFLLCYSGLSLAGFSGKLDLYALLLASDNPDNVKMGARSIDQDHVKDPAILDLVAQRFCIYVNRDANMDEKANLDGVSWLAVALGDSGNTQYRPMLEQALQKTTNKKNKEYITKALKALGGDSGGTYQPSCPSRDEYRSKILAGRAPANVDRDKFSGVKNGDSLDALYAALGAPSDAKQYIYETFRPFIGHINLENLELFYGDAGSVRLDYSSDHWEVYQTIVSRTIPGLDMSGPNHDAMAHILSGDPDVYIQAAQDLIDAKQFAPEVLDVAAQRVWMDRAATDKHVVDGMSWMCKYLGASHNVRYRAFLTTVADKAADSKLRKYAKESLGMLPSGDAPQFQPPPGG